MTLKELRLESGLKAFKIAEKLNISRREFNYLEKSVYRISDDKVKILCQLYGKTKSEILKAWEDGRNE